MTLYEDGAALEILLIITNNFNTVLIIQSDLKKTTSLIGMAYLNYIYQNDLENEHFCESMLLMNSQLPAGTNNPYVRLFEPDMASKTMAILEDIQLLFDYSIARTNPPMEKLQSSLSKIQSAL